MNMSTMRCFLAVIAAAVAAPAFAREFPEPLTYVKKAGDGKYVFVMLGPIEVDRARTDAAELSALRMYREKYPQSGLYSATDDRLIWAIEDAQPSAAITFLRSHFAQLAPYGYAPSEETFLSSDGVHLVRIEGDWWRTKDYAAPKRLAPEIEDAQIDSPAISFFANGKLVRSYRLRELATNISDLPHSPQHVLWMAGAVLNESNGRFLLQMQDSHRIAFDYRTGDIVGRTPLGLGNPLSRTILAVSGVLTLLIFAGWAWFAFGRKREVTSLPLHS